MTTYRERRERRADRREEWAKGRRAKAAGAHTEARQLADAIPLGQPILQDHHSAPRHRRHIAKIGKKMDQALDHSAMANKHEQAADTIRRQLDKSIYRDDVDAIERLERRLADLEAERADIKAINAWTAKVARKEGFSRRTRNYLHHMSDHEKRAAADVLAQVIRHFKITNSKDLMNALQFNGTLGYPAYHLRNIGGRISQTRKRLKEARGES